MTRESYQNLIAISKREGSIEALEARLSEKNESAFELKTRGVVSILEITGPIFRYANLFTRISGATSYQIAALDLQAAIDDPNTTSIVIYLDTPGGMVSGTSEFSDMIRSSKKPVYVYVGNLAASAGYWIASAAKEIIIDKTAELGSIGVVTTVSTEKSDDSLEIVSSQSPHKRPDCSTEEGKCEVLRVVNDLADVFVTTIATNRGVTTDHVLENFGKGGLLVGQKAIDAGMADRLGSFEGLITELNQSPTKVQKMDYETLKAEHPELHNQAFTEGFQAGTDDGKNGELDRIKSVKAASLPGHEDDIEKMMFDGRTTGAEAALAVIKAERELAVTARQSIEDESPQPLSTVPDAPMGASQPVDGSQEAYDSSPGLQDEFKTYSAYTAYHKAMKSGKVRVKSNK